MLDTITFLWWWQKCKTIWIFPFYFYLGCSSANRNSQLLTIDQDYGTKSVCIYCSGKMQSLIFLLCSTTLSHNFICKKKHINETIVRVTNRRVSKRNACLRISIRLFWCIFLSLRVSRWNCCCRLHKSLNMNILETDKSVYFMFFATNVRIINYNNNNSIDIFHTTNQPELHDSQHTKLFTVHQRHGPRYERRFFSVVQPSEQTWFYLILRLSVCLYCVYDMWFVALLCYES